MDFKKFYLSPQGRVNRKQFWLWLVLPFTVIEIVLVLVDVATENYNPELGIGLLSGIFALVAADPDRYRLYQTLSRPRQIRLVGACHPYPDHRRDLDTGRTRLSQGHAGIEPVRSTGDGLIA